MKSLLERALREAAPWWTKERWKPNTLPMGFEVLKPEAGFADTEVGAFMVGKSGKWEGPVKFATEKGSRAKAKARALTLTDITRAAKAGAIKPYGNWETWKATMAGQKSKAKMRRKR